MRTVRMSPQQQFIGEMRHAQGSQWRAKVDYGEGKRAIVILEGSAHQIHGIYVEEPAPDSRDDPQ